MTARSIEAGEQLSPLRLKCSLTCARAGWEGGRALLAGRPLWPQTFRAAGTVRCGPR